ncbi:MAG: ribonuclease III [Elusimicrobiota bacterium]
MPADFSKLEKTIGFKFKDKEILRKALTHKSYADEAGTQEFNERMEFLGDSILAAVVAEYLFLKYSGEDEGKLSQLKSQLVSRQNLGRWAKNIDIGDFIFISKGEEASGGRKRESLLSNTFEALIAAVFLDGGFEAAKKFISTHLVKHRRVIINDAKSKLQEYIQSAYKSLPEYRIIAESGPDHEKIFEIGVFFKKNLLGSGNGKSKKEAEQSAAKKALKEIRKNNKEIRKNNK